MTTPEKKLENTERNAERGATPAVATSPFARSVASLKDAISYGEGRVPETVLLDAAETLERLSQRRELSTEHTVIGFFGATGSGKSTLFNAIAGQNIALSAPTRPTTSTVQAAIWEAEGSEELLDWLGIDKRVYPQTQALATEGETTEGNEAGGNNKVAGGVAAPNAVTEPAPGLFNRIRRAVGGRGEMRTRTGGLILLDMPDFDSVTTTNRDLAARMMRYVDVLVWVVDPQKYADAVIHRDFMVPLAASGAQALCVLNQADKLAPAEVPAVLASLTRLLQAEGTEAHLLAAPIAVSARTGEGVDVLRDLLAQVAAAKSLSLQRTDAQLHATASQLRTYAGGEGTVLAGAYALEAEQKLVKACYSSSQAEQVLQAATASYRRAAGQRTGWILTRWMSRLKADPLRRLHLGQQDETKSASKAEKSAGIVEAASAGARVVFVSDAGMPTVSDPGFRLARAAIDAGVPLSVLPGPSAPLVALALSGLPSDRFAFEGFLPRKDGEATRYLEGLATDPHTLIFFESPRRAAATLTRMAEVFGTDRAAAMCRELTKDYEEVRRGTLGQLAEGADDVLGEVTIVVAGYTHSTRAEDHVGAVLALAAEGMRLKDAAAEVAAATGARKNDLYKAALAAR